MDRIKKTLDTMRYVRPLTQMQLLVGLKTFGALTLLGSATVFAQEVGTLPTIIPATPGLSSWELLASGLLSALVMLGGQFISAWREASKLRGVDLERIRGERDAAKAEAQSAKERALRAEVSLQIKERDPRNRADD